MIQIPNNKKLVNMLTVLTVAGEMPLVAASQAGSHEGYRKLFYELSKKQVFVNTKTNEQMRVKLIHMSDRGDKRRCRLYKNAIPILDWIGTRAYYEEMFPNNKMSGGEQNRFRNAMVAEAVLMMLESGVEVLSTMLPALRINNRYNSFHGRSCFYSARQLKQTLNKGMNKIVSSRIVGALFAGNNVYAVYNTRSSAIKWKGMNEMKTKHILTDLARVNGDISVCDSAVIFGNDMITAEYFSARSGEITVEYDIYSKSERTGSMEKTYNHSTQKTKRRLFTPDEILCNKSSELKCFCNGLGVMTLNKFDYSRHPAYPHIVKADANGYEPERKHKSKQVTETQEEKPAQKQEKGITKIVMIDDMKNV